MADAIEIEIDGLADLNRSLRKVGNEAPKMLRIALNDVIGVVVDDAQPKVPRRTGKARRSIKPSSTRTKGRIKAGGRRAPYYPWLDFGGRVGRAKAVARKFLKRGRYIYPAYFRRRDSGDLDQRLEVALVSVARQAGLEVET